jgi:hypothetical protein
LPPIGAAGIIRLLMLVSRDPAFLFVHIDKSAGSNIQHAFRPFAPPVRPQRWRRKLTLLGRFNRVAGLHRALEWPEHAPLEVPRRCLPPAVFDGMFKFAFVRNPWDRLVSRHAYLMRKTAHPRHEFVKSLGSFEAYLEWEIARGKMHQHTYVTGPDGRLATDFVGYYERLADDFAEAARRIGVPAVLPPPNHSPHRDYREVYTDRTRDMVAGAFARDIDLFGYTFEGLA